MPRLSTRLISTERACQVAKAHGRRTEYRVAGLRGLVLRANANGTKSWSCNYKSSTTASWRKVSLGSYPTIGLQRAKELALDCFADVRDGRDPLAAGPGSDLTFTGLSDQYLEAHKGRHSQSWARAVRQTLQRDILPHLHSHRACAVKRHDIARIVERVAKRGALASANEALKVTRTIFRWAVSTGRCETDPTFGVRKFPSKPRERVLTDQEISHAWTLRTRFLLAFRLQLLTAARIGEVLKAEKSEFDLEQMTWTIPGMRTKSRRTHQLPLSSLAVNVVEEAMVASCRSGWLFPGHQGDKPLCTQSAATVLSRLNKAAGITERFTPHDLRRSAATRMADLGTPDEVVERILNHAGTTTSRRHYNHAKRFDEMRDALGRWAVQLADLANSASGRLP